MVQIPEPKFHPLMKQAVREGRKCATSRREKLGEIGDWWEESEPIMLGKMPCRPARYRLIEVRAVPFGIIAGQFHRLEGFPTIKAFKEFWKGLHRGHLPDDMDCRYMHVFARIHEGWPE